MRGIPVYNCAQFVLRPAFGRPYALVVTQDKVVSVSANIDGGQPWRRTVGTDNIVYTDWQRDDPVLGRNKWTTFLTKELPPLVDKEFDTTKVNAIAGISMAGTSVLNLAIAAPKLYRSAAAYSGCARTSDPVGQAYIRMVVADRGQGNLNNMWGPVNSAGWRDNDPYIHADKLRGTKVYMTSGTGMPGQFDRLEAPLVAGDPLTLANQMVIGGIIEAAVNECTKQMVSRMRALKVPHEVTFRPSGTHSWGYWERDLETTWPKIAADLR